MLRLLNAIATVLPDNEPDNAIGMAPDLIARLYEAALRTRMVSSGRVRSAIDRRCRGANREAALRTRVVGLARVKSAIDRGCERANGEAENVARVELSLRLEGLMYRIARSMGRILCPRVVVRFSKCQISRPVLRKMMGILFQRNQSKLNTKLS